MGNYSRRLIDPPLETIDRQRTSKISKVEAMKERGSGGKGGTMDGFDAFRSPEAD